MVYMAARRVLLIEDNAGAREGLERLLTEDGFEVRSASSGELGLECTGEFRPDVVVCDFDLPGIDGLEVLRRMRGSNPDVFFIVLTAGADHPEVACALRAEAQGFLGKPVDLPRFRAMLRRDPDVLMPPAAPNP
jgi:two-component system response regulator HydG